MLTSLPASGSTSWYPWATELHAANAPVFPAASLTQSAIATALSGASTAGGGVVVLPPGTLTLSTGLTVPSKVILRGAGRDATRLQWTPTTGDAITLSGDRAGIADMTVERTSGTPTAGALVVLSSGNSLSVRSVILSGGYDNLRGENAYGYLIDDCYLVNPVRYSCYLRSITQPDRGDSVMRSCTFDSATRTGAAIRYESGGGLKIATTKILHHDYGIDLQASDGTQTSILTVTGCSIEDQGTACVRLGKAGTTGKFTEIELVGNQLNGGANATAIIANDGVEDVAVTGNSLKGDTAHTAITLDTLQRAIITGNTFVNWNKAITKTASTPRIVVGDNNYGAVPIPLTDDVAQNLAGPGRSVRSHRAMVSTTSTTTYTNLFRVEWNVYRGALLDVVVEGLLGQVGNVTRHIRLLARRDAGNVSVTTVSDTAAGAACDVQFDVTTTAGSLYLGVRRNTAAAGNQLDALVTLTAEGGVRLIEVL